MKKNNYIIACDFYKYKPSVNLLGSTTLSVTKELEDKPTVKLYLRGHENMECPRLNVKELAEKFTNKKAAQKIASQLNRASFVEGKVICKVETV